MRVLKDVSWVRVAFPIDKGGKLAEQTCGIAIIHHVAITGFRGRFAGHGHPET